MFKHHCLTSFQITESMCVFEHVWMDGWMGSWMERWMYGWMERWKDGCMDVWMDEWMDGWMFGWLDGCMDGCMDGWIFTIFCKKYFDCLPLELNSYEIFRMRNIISESVRICFVKLR